jgi:hypothetical protein
MIVRNSNYTGGTSLTVSGCTAGTLYNFKVATINIVGDSVLSSEF